MSKQMLEIKYRCMHPSCCVNCREGLIGIEEDLFNELSSQYEEKELFRSPRGICRLGFSQPFKVIRMSNKAEAAPEQAAVAPETDPIAILMAEHKAILGKLEGIEDQVRKRDVDGLWVSTADIENALIIHSAKKEEEVLFPALSDLMPLGQGLVSIIKEDHREILSLLHAFRSALEDGDILDGLIRSMTVSLRSHIRKEDYEFFELVNKCLTDDIRKTMFDGMKKIDETHVTIVAGDRLKLTAERKAAKEKRDMLDESILAVRDLVNVDSCCH